jgi:LysR family hydrogen peroxide-inducible transcriptional activator
MVSLIQLEYIVAVDTYRHFATAADKCFVTQPTLSMQIKKMEEDLGVIIFDRSKQPVVPTIAGEKIIEQARDVLAEWKKIEVIASESKDIMTGELHIGVIPTISPYLLPRFSGEFRRKFPGVDLKVKEMVTERIAESLLKGIIDVGILVTPLNEKGVFEMPLYYEEMLIYSSKNHPYNKQQVVNVTQIKTDDIWLLTDGHCFRHQVVNLCDIHHYSASELPFEFEGGNLDTLIKIIDKEGGYTLIPELSWFDMDDNKRQQVRHFENMVPLREVSLVFTRKFQKTKLIEELAKEIKSSVPPSLLSKDRGMLVEWKNHLPTQNQ